MRNLARIWAFWALAAMVLVAVAGCDFTLFGDSGEGERPAETRAAVDYNVVIVVIDGPRWTETFGDTSHAYVDQMWNELRPLGTLCTNFKNLGTTVTVPGHGAIVSGVFENLDNTGAERPSNPTIFEYLRKATGLPQSDTAVVGGKTKLDVCAYSDHVDYGAAYGAADYVTSDTDVQTFADLESVLATDHPRLMLASFSDVDQIAHSGDWQGYLDTISTVDSLITLTWNTLQADTVYAGKTYMFITADHGRHDDAHGGFQNHGDSCDGCRHIPLLALGPNIRADYTVSTLYTQRDLCTTAGTILGVPTPYSNGYTISELFEPVMTGVVP